MKRSISGKRLQTLKPMYFLLITIDLLLKNAAPAPVRPVLTLLKVINSTFHSEIEVKTLVSTYQQTNKGKIQTSYQISDISRLWMDSVSKYRKMCNYSLLRKTMRRS